MKDCLEALRLRLPPGQTNKSSKWETLTLAIDYIEMLERMVAQSQRDRAVMQAVPKRALPVSFTSPVYQLALRPATTRISWALQLTQSGPWGSKSFDHIMITKAKSRAEESASRVVCLSGLPTGFKTSDNESILGIAADPI
ncbi:hypothetical protein N7536_002529 [Penicillium majusculum]|nr:hypothetical protein N7536_002529 [Penicillium majusculum]